MLLHRHIVHPAWTRLVVVLVFCTLHSVPLHAQEPPLAQASMVARHPLSGHSPRKALLLSTVLPGAGQVYNGQAWKLPIVYGALGAGSYMVYQFYGKMRDSKKEYLYRISHGDEVQNPAFSEDPTANVYNLYETYNQRFQLSIIVTAALYGLNLLDAYVFGHLYEFEIDDTLTLSCYPALNYEPALGISPVATLTLRF